MKDSQSSFVDLFICFEMALTVYGNDKLSAAIVFVTLIYINTEFCNLLEFFCCKI